MNRREMFKGIIGAAVATALPSMPFSWREKTLMDLMAEKIRAGEKAMHAAISEALYSDAPMTYKGVPIVWDTTDIYVPSDEIMTATEYRYRELAVSFSVKTPA